MKHTLYCDVAISIAMLSQEKRIKRKREDAEANAKADGRHTGVSDNNVVHVEAEAHATQSTDRIEQTAGSSEGVKKIKEKRSTTEFVNIERKGDERNADDDCTSGNVQNDGTLHPRGNKKSRRHSVMQLRMWVGLFRPRLRCSCARSQTVRRR